MATANGLEMDAVDTRSCGRVFIPKKNNQLWKGDGSGYHYGRLLCNRRGFGVATARTVAGKGEEADDDDTDQAHCERGARKHVH